MIPSLQRQSPLQRLRILIVSTPKTGNTWLRSLLAAIYDLPTRGIIYPFDKNQAESLGESWVSFHHFLPEPHIVEWLTTSKIFVITTVRHPGDVLISLYHHIHEFPSGPMDLANLKEMLQSPFERRHIHPSGVHTFRDELECSLAWKRTGISTVVRYEDLRLRTLKTLGSLASAIQPVEQARIEQAIEKCEIDQMRSLSGKSKGFFRSGRVGEWRDVFTPDILEVFAKEPYACQMEELGYSFQSTELQNQEIRCNGVRNPFRGIERFENGVAISPLIVDLYLSLDPSVNEKWFSVMGCGAGSFFEWISGPCEHEGAGIFADVFVSTMAYHIYRNRWDVRAAFPSLSGPYRARYAEWFIRHAAEVDSLIDPYFVREMEARFVEWGNGSSPEFPESSGELPLTDFQVNVYRTRPEVRGMFPSLDGAERVRYVEWFIRNGRYLDPTRNASLISHAKPSFVKWGKLRSPEDSNHRPWWPVLTNYAAHLCHSRADIREAFPDYSGGDRWNLLRWIADSDSIAEEMPELTDAVRMDLERCAKLRAFLNPLLRR